MSAGDVIAGRYELLELVGSGGMSSVWRAHDRLLDRTSRDQDPPRAASRPDEEYVERFRREARSVAQLSHPNIVTVIDRGEDDGRQFIVFEYVEGENLKQLIERSGRLPVRDALVLALQMGRALAFAHERGLVHRDVKPQNVLLNEDGQAEDDRLRDRALGRRGRSDRSPGLCSARASTSRPSRRAAQRVDALTDVYSLGVVLYELLTGTRPVQGRELRRDRAQARQRAAAERPRAQPGRAGRGSAMAVERAMAKQPGRPLPARWTSSVAELQACLAELDPASEEATMISRQPVIPPPKKQAKDGASLRRRRGILWPIAAVLAVFAVAGAGGLRHDRASATAASRERRHDADPADGVSDRTIRSATTTPSTIRSVTKATDGEFETYWTTETTSSSTTRSGVGIVLDARREVEPETLTIRTDTAGFTAQIRAGDDAVGPFDRVVARPRSDGRGRRVRAHRRESPLLRVWITASLGVAHVNEVQRALELELERRSWRSSASSIRRSSSSAYGMPEASKSFA